ncbi:MAG: multiheme c-type cytochrome [Planctomycetota bacterium]|nr:multiheme c-type cytochrome [Planctomycetota bacterium]
MKFMNQALYAGVLGLSCGLTLFIVQPNQSILPNAEAKGKKWKYFGSATCGGGSCHAAKEQEKERPANEYITWKKKDRHSKAFDSLFEEESEEMCEELDIEEPSKDKACTICHTTDVTKDLHGEKFNREDGVSCDGCHGPAEGWYKPHTKTHKYEDMLAKGMWDTRNLFRRADVCVKCHLQIDPKLVDAGHPDLSFELFTHSHREPPHWYERQTWDGIRAWSVGQTVSLRDALTKIKSRLGQKDNEEELGFAIAQGLSHTTVFRHAVGELGETHEKAFILDLHGRLSNGKTKGLLEACKKGITILTKLGRRLATADVFNEKMVVSVFKKVANDPDLSSVEEYQAEQVAGALFALYNSKVYGKGPRLQKPLKEPEQIKAIFVRPAIWEPADLFDDESSEFKEKLWLKRLKEAAKLVK